VDALSVGIVAEQETRHISQGELGVLSFSFSSSSEDPSSFDDILFGSRPTETSVKSLPEAHDLLDFLAPSHATSDRVRLELTVDSREVSSKNAQGFLLSIKDLVENQSHEFL
jgi:hypothetical protein